MNLLPYLRCLLLATLATIPAAAQNTITVENSTQAQGFELHAGQMHWWHHPTFLDGDNSVRLYQSVEQAPRRLDAGAPTGGFAPAGDLAASAPYTPFLYSFTPLIDQSGLPAIVPYESSVVRDAAWFYYVKEGTVRRRLAAGDTTSPVENVTRFDGFGSTTISAAGCCLVQDGRLWYHDGGTLSSVALNGPLQSRTVDTHFVTPGGGTVKKMTVNRGRQVLLLTDGRLYFKDGLTGAFSGQQLLGSGVNDFAVRTDRVQFLGSTIDMIAIYGADGSGVWRWSPVQAGKEYVPAGTNGPAGPIYSVALDGSRLFISTLAVILGQGSQPHTWRKDWPRNQWQQPWSGNWDSITTTLGHRNLRSDGLWLYGLGHFSGEIRAISTDAPALRLDVEARGMEVVQVIQDLNNDVPLLAGREAWVRGYAWIAENTTAFGNALRFPAELQVRRGGTTLARLAPVNDPLLRSANDMRAWRLDTAKGYLFRVPGELMAAGATEFRFTVNPSGALPETSSATRTNTITDTVTAVAKVPTVLPFVRIATTFGTFEPLGQPATYRDNLERARSLLPVSRIIAIPRPTIVSKPVVTVCYTDVLGVSVPYPCIADRSFDMATEHGLALQWLATYRFLHPSFLLDGILIPPLTLSHDVHWTGTAPVDVVSFNGLGYGPGLPALLVRMTSEAASNAGPWDRERGGRSLAHELGHNYGRAHINFGDPDCGPAPGCDPHPVPAVPGQFDATDLTLPTTCAGFDSLTLTPVAANNGVSMVGDLMSYASSRWTSRQTYLAILNAIPNPPAAAARQPRGGNAPGTLLLVRAMLNRARTAVAFQPSFVLPAGWYPQDAAEGMLAQAAALPPSHPLRLHLLDAAGANLADSALLLPEESDEESTGPALLTQFTAFPPATARLQIRQNAAVIGELPLSASAPVVQVTAAAVQSGALRVAWSADDADGDRLSFAVQFSNDDGLHWTALAADTSEVSLTTDAALLPGGTQCRVRVLATDGVRTATAMSALFSLARRAPLVQIGGLNAGERMPFGALRELTAEVTDSEDGVMEDDALTWTLHDLSRSLQTTASGPRYPLHGLAPGSYRLTLSATDSDGMTGTGTADFAVSGVTIPAAAEAPVLDGVNGDAAYADSPVMRMDFGSGAFAHYYGTTVCAHHGGRLYVCITDLQKAAGLGRVRLLLDTDHSGGAPTAQDIALEVKEDGTLTEWRGNGSGWAQSASPGGAVALARLDSGSSWSIELALPDALLGGWTQDAGLAVVSYTPASTAGSWPAGLTASAAPSGFALVGPGTAPAVPNAAPVASAGNDRVVSTEAGDAVLLDASLSFDPEGSPLTFQWQQLSGPALAVLTGGGVQHSLAAPEVTGTVTCVFQVTVSDGSLSATDSVALTFTGRVPQVLTESSAAPVRLTPQGLAGALAWPGGTGQPVVLQTSTDLTAWQDLGLRLTDHLSTVLFSDGPPVPGGKRFYRLRAHQPEPVQNPGNALRFDGTNGLVTVPHDPAFNSYPLTVTAYVLTTTNDATSRGIVEKYIGGTRNGWLMFLHQGRLRAFYFRDPNNKVFTEGGDFNGLDGGPVADGFWHHCAFTVDATGGKLYVDGVLRDSLAWTGTPGPCTTTTALKFGKYDTLPAFFGDIEEVSTWNTALAQPEIAEAIRVSPNAGAPGLTSLWRFDEADGPTVFSASHPGYNGTLSGSVQRVPSTAPVYRQ